MKRKPPVIASSWGTVSEGARRQAAINCKLDPVKRFQMEQMLIKLMGSEERGLAEAKRRYPEAYSI
jgi:hypothetical protein